MKPCCGSIDFNPTTLDPGESTTLDVNVRVGSASGPLTHYAVVETNFSGRERLEVWTTVTVYPKAQIEKAQSNAVTPVPRGKEAQRAYVAVSHGTASEPPLSLDDAVLDATLPIEWQGPAEDRTIDDGLIERRRPFSVRLSGDGQTGQRTEQITLKNGEEAAHVQILRWEVKPAVQASPPGLVIPAEADTIERTIQLKSRDGQPFHVTGVTADFPGIASSTSDQDEPKTAHPVNLTIRPGPDNTGQVGHVTIEIDHPAQSSVDVSVLIIGGGATE